MLELLDELAGMGTLYLTLTGGEMFLRKDWYTIAARARDLGFSLRLFSNGATIDVETAEAIRTLHATVEVSLYSMDAEVFDRITTSGLAPSSRRFEASSSFASATSRSCSRFR